VVLAGFTTAVFPVISAPVVIPTVIANGKLNGATTPKTPYGWRSLTQRWPGVGSCVSAVYPSFRSSSLL